MPVPAVPENLSKGVIDAAVIPWEVTGALKVTELVENHTTFPGNSLYTTTMGMVMNKDRYDSMPADLRAILDANSGLAFSGFAGAQMQADDEPSRQIAVDRGNNIIALSDAEIAAWKTAAAPTAQQWVAEVGKAGLDGQALIEEAKALIAQHSK